MLMRVGLFLLTNLAVLLVVSVVFSVLGLSSQTGGLGQLLLMCAIMGFVGSFISLALSKWMAIRSTGAKVIQTPQNAHEAWLKSTVQELATKAGIGMPDVAIYQAPDPNAFATGMNKNKALVAVSTGLMERMSQDEVKAVLAHEVSHVANGDMVTLTLIQGVVNTFVMFLARLAGGAVDRALLGNRDSAPGIGYYASVMIFEILFGVLASIVVMWFSRRREYRADAGAASLYNTQSMIKALEALQGPHTALPKEIQAFGIAGVKSRFGELFMSHPPIPKRIEALRTSKMM